MPLEDYQLKLENFISSVRAIESPNKYNNVEYYGEVLAGSPILPRKSSVPLSDYEKEVRAAKVRENEAFFDLTGMRHQSMLNNWAGGGHLTSCNAFVGRAGVAMGAQGLGSFNIEDMLRSINKSHCWCTPFTGQRPRFGDVFETRSLTPGKSYFNIHVGVSLHFVGDKWYTIEGGQGGAGLGVDKVARRTRHFDPQHMLGWIDMKLFLSKTPPIPDWLIGNWEIFCNDKTYIYRFDRYGEVTQLISKSNLPLDSLAVLDKGQVIMNAGSDDLQVRWGYEGGVERFTYARWDSFPGILEKMKGTAADGSAMTGIRS